MRVELELSRGGARLTGPAGEARPSGAQGPGQLTYELRDELQQLLASGSVDDPREVRGEYLDGDHYSRTGEPLGFGSIVLELPVTDGTLALREADGRELPELPFHPSELAVATHRQALTHAGDVVAPPIRIRNSAPSKLDLLVIGEGFLESELPTFRTEAKAVIDGLVTVPDYARYSAQIGGLRADVRSRASGISDPDAGLTRDTAFDVSFGKGTSRRCLWFTSGEGYFAATQLRTQANAKVVVILANTLEYGGCAANGVLVISRHPSSLQVLAHELGHAVFGLHDEYDSTGVPCAPGSGASGPNVSTGPSLADLPWSDLVVGGTPLPTSETQASAAKVGAFEGADFCTTGKWRPQLHCMMESLGQPMCAVCRREMQRFFATTGAEALERVAAAAGQPHHLAVSSRQRVEQ